MLGGRWRYRAVAALVFVLAMLGALRAQAPLTITTARLEPVALGSNVRAEIKVTGGVQPYTWQVSQGKLPPGLKLSPKTGVIAGRPTKPGVYHFNVLVMDSGAPAMQIQREFTLAVTAALSIDWREPPAVHGQAIEGSVKVSNQSQREVSLTVIVMAVNQIGRATSLGYQKFTLASGAEQVIPFGASPGTGAYIVHADAVAEVASTHTIHRARKQTEAALVIQAPE
jgi:Putative Ig domain